MTGVKRIPATALPILAVLAGFGCVVAGLYMLLGLAPTLIAGGIVLAAAGLLVDVGGSR